MVISLLPNHIPIPPDLQCVLPLNLLLPNLMPLYTLPTNPPLSMHPNPTEANAPKSTTDKFHAEESATNKFNDATLNVHETVFEVAKSNT